MASLPTSLASLPNLGPGSTGSAVLSLQNALIAAGYMTQAEVNTGPGTYGPKTTAAVARWQADNGINTQGNPGYFGPISKGFISGAQQKPSPISPTLPKADYMATTTGQMAAATNPKPPQGVLPPEMQNLGIYNLSPEAFKTLVPQLVPGTSAYKKALDKIETSFYDILQQQMTAKTEQEKSLADYNWNTLRDYIQTNLNITLSNDAIQAWDQLQTMKNQFAGQGIEGSGLEAEAIDDYLRKVRTTDASAREAAKTKEEAGMQAYYTGYATPEQIKAFAAEHPDLAKAWGLIPSDAIRASLTPAALKAKYPNMSDEDIARNISMILDDFGNYRSNLYQRHLFGSNTGIDRGNVDTANVTYDQYGNPINVPVRPGDTGIYDIQQAASKYQYLNANAAQALKDFQAHQELTPSTSENQFIRPTTSTTTRTPSSTTAPSLSNPMPGTTSRTTTTTTKPASTTPIDYTFRVGQETIQQYNDRTGITALQKQYGTPTTTTSYTAPKTTTTTTTKPIDYTFHVGSETIDQYNARIKAVRGF